MKKVKNKFPNLSYSLTLSKKLLTFSAASSSGDLELTPNRTQRRAVRLCLHPHFTDTGGICAADCNRPVLESGHL